MPAFMRRFDSQAYAALRIVAGLLFLWHGTQKIFGFPVPMPADAPAFVVWVAGGIELVGGMLVLVGFYTKPAAFLCSGLMAAAYWMAHGTRALFPLENGGELAVLYCFVFLFLAAHGSGIWSVDEARKRA
jgi:putative oxidoreductase